MRYTFCKNSHKIVVECLDPKDLQGPVDGCSECGHTMDRLYPGRRASVAGLDWDSATQTSMKEVTGRNLKNSNDLKAYCRETGVEPCGSINPSEAFRGRVGGTLVRKRK